MDATGLPIYRGHSVGDLRTVELGEWRERQCNAAFTELAGQEGITEGRIEEIPPGKSLPPLRLAVDELVYVVSGQGICTVATEGRPKKTFEWQKFSLFLLPGGVTHQFTNMQGDQPARLLHYSYMPLAMSLIMDRELLFNPPHETPDRIYNDDNPYAEAQLKLGRGWGTRNMRQVWTGNFFPDMRGWDKLNNLSGRGAGGASVMMRYPGSEVSSHMSVFPPGTYKKGHRHGPGRIIVIPEGEGFSIMWEEGHEKVIVPWQEASMFVPPDRWFHQHFNLGGTPARYLALHPPPQFYGRSEQVEDRERDQIEYPDEDPFVRNYFEEELAKRGNKTLMPDECYKDYNYTFAAAIAGD